MAKETSKKTPNQILRDDHKKVKQLFKEFEDAKSEKQKKRIVSEAILELKIHTAVEEEIFYPAVAEQADEEEDQLLVDEAIEEHAAAKRLMEELEGMEPGQERYDAKFIVLSEMVKHHIEEEEAEMFPDNKDVSGDAELGRRMLDRKAELEREMKEEMAQTR
jgi:hypothetical protein